MKLPKMQPISRDEMELSKHNIAVAEVRKDIAKIDSLSGQESRAELEMLHRYLDGKYQACIENWGNSMYGYANGYGVNYEWLDTDSIKDNLVTIKAKLEGLILSWNVPNRRIVQNSALDSDAYLRLCDEVVNISNKKVFIVHGHDDKHKYEMSDWLKNLDLEPIILHLTPNMGIKTIIDKIEENSDVGCAIVLMTADDLGRAKNEEILKPRARQNVVFEAGYFLGKLGARRVILLYDSGLEAPSDLSGVVYIELDIHGGWKEQIRREFKAMGIEYSV